MNQDQNALLNIGIVGAGRGGWSLLRVLEGLPKVRVVGVCDLNAHAPALAEAKRGHIPTFGSVSELLANTELDWLINVSHSSLTQRHLLEQELGDKHVNIVDGAAAEVVWRFLVGFRQMVLTCPGEERECANNVAWALISSISDAVKQVQNHLTDIAFHDPLTGLFTRRILMEFLERETRNAQRRCHPLSVLLTDVDHFKSINDSFGHATGDDTLRDLADLMRKHHRQGDLNARVGGEEFVTVLPDTSPDDALHIAERLRQRVVDAIARPDGVPLTVSIGVATLLPPKGEPPHADCSPATLLARADTALYHAKNSGRNRVMMYQESWERVTH